MTVERRRSDAVLGERDGGAESTIETRPSDAVQQSFLDLDEDLATRDAIVEALDETLFVEAGAGSGKTKALVDRVVALVTRRGVPMREIAAVTFTEKAAAELRDRIRRTLEAAARGGEAVAAARAALALEELDGAAVSTLHAFAQRLLAEHPIEAGLPPRIEVLDDIASQLAFEERWTRFVDELLDDPAIERTLLLALNADTTLNVLRTLALACNANWDLVAERMGPEPDPPPLDGALAPVLVALTELHELTGHCRAADDKLLGLLGSLASWHEELVAAPDEYEQLRLLTVGTPKGSVTQGRKDNWPRACPVESVRDRVKALRLLVDETAAKLAEVVLRRLAWELARFTLREAEERRRHGQLEFHDLLVLARAVLRDPEHGWDVRQRLRAAVHAPPARRVPGHRPHPVRSGRVAGIRGARRARAPLGRAAGRPGPPVRGGRPQAVDLPVPARRHRGIPPGPLRVRRRAAPPHAELPHRPPGHRLRQRGVPRSHRRGAGVATRVRGARTRARGRAGGATGRAPRCDPRAREAHRRRAARARGTRRGRGHRACAAGGLAGVAALHRRDRAVRAVSTG